MRNRRKQSSNGIISEEGGGWGRGGEEGGDNPATAGSSHIRDSLVPPLLSLYSAGKHISIHCLLT